MIKRVLMLSCLERFAVRKGRLLIVLVILLAAVIHAQANDIWPRPVIVPVPEKTAGLSQAAVSLNGTWKFTLDPPKDFHLNSVDPSGWSDVQVPGEPWMQGLEIKRDTKYPYKKKIFIPRNFRNTRVFLRFDGVYTIGKVWVNGHFAGEHYGGFTSWNLEITDFVTPGKDAWLTVSINDLTDDVSFASGYASRFLGNDFDHFIGGILRDVTLFAVPKNHLTRFHVETDLDDNYRNASLKISVGVDFQDASEAKVEFELRDPTGKKVRLEPSSAMLSKQDSEHVLEIPVTNPQKWDAEHPNLYKLTAHLIIKSKTMETLSRKMGFREVEVCGNRLLVNGTEVKLRGGCRHSAHPLAGRAYVEDLAEKDVLLYKEANINYVRTSHYPTSQRFLEMADKYGLYIEEEAAIAWTNHHAARGKLNGLHDDPKYLPFFMSNISEMIERDRSHPSIIMWSLGNENTKWGRNFELERDYARLEDSTRPLKTGHNAYGGGWDTDEHADLDSYHYPGWNSNFDKDGKPYIFDEGIHVMCYYGKDSIADRDPGVRDFWGESIKQFWEKIYPSKGTAGIAIWGTVDDVFFAPQRSNGYGYWGIFDGWRRPKPEFWHTKKAYSPIRIVNKTLGNPGRGKALEIPVKNWFDHTNFSELKIEWQVAEDMGTIDLNLAPSKEGKITIPARRWKDDDVVSLRFCSKHPSLKLLIDEFEMPLVDRVITRTETKGLAPNLSQTDKEIIVSGEDFSIAFDKRAGRIKQGIFKRKELLIGGPQLNLFGMALEAFKVSFVDAAKNKDHVLINIAGSHGSISVAYAIRIDDIGQIETTYTITNPPKEHGAYDEVGISYMLNDSIDTLEWDRKALWSVYPDDHIGRPKGKAVRYKGDKAEVYREKPSWPWSMDMKDYLLWGKDHQGWDMTNDFRSAKHHIYSADIYESATGRGIRVESDDASQAVRLQKIELHDSFVIDNTNPAVVHKGNWTTMKDGGNYFGTEQYSNHAADSIGYTFTGTSIAWITVKNHNCGMADVYLDGQLVADDIDLYATGKKHKQAVFSQTGMEDKEHRIRIVVTGKKNPESDNCFLVSDAFTDVEDKKDEVKKGVQVNVNSHWAYNLGWGNYNRSSEIESGFSDTVRVRLFDSN